MMASNLATVGVVIWGVYRTAEGDMTMGAMVACSMLTGRAMAPLGQISSLIVRFHQSLTSLRGLNRLMELPSERPAGKVFLRRPTVDGAIEFRDVSFAYPGQQGKALDGVRSEEQTAELQSLMRNSYAVFCLKKQIFTFSNLRM